MKTYMCDNCGGFVSDPMRRIYMREIWFRDGKKTERKRVHFCTGCLEQIAEISLNRRASNDTKGY